MYRDGRPGVLMTKMCVLHGRRIRGLRGSWWWWRRRRR
jgi:hypothetical protein